MIKRAADYLSALPAIFIDGSLYMLLAVFQFLQIQFASDEASKFIGLEVLFYIKTGVGSCAAGLLAVKLFRSTAFADHQNNKTGSVLKNEP